MSLPRPEREPSRLQEEEAEHIAYRDKLIISKRNLDRYEAAAEDIEGFFNTVWPIAVEQAKHILRKTDNKDMEVIMLGTGLMANYTGIWQMYIAKKP